MAQEFDFLLTLPVEIKQYFLVNLSNIETNILDEVILPINDRFGKVATGRLRTGYKVESNKLGNVIVFTIKNTATAPNYPGKYYWVVVRDGRRAYSGSSEHTPPWRDIEEWMKNKGIAGSPFVMAKNINEKGFIGKPDLFKEIVDESEKYLSDYVDNLMGGLNG